MPSCITRKPSKAPSRYKIPCSHIVIWLITVGLVFVTTGTCNVRLCQHEPFLSSGSSNIQYSPANLSSTPSPPSHSPGTGAEGSINSVSLVPGNVNIAGQDGIGGVQVLVDSGASSPGMLVQGGNRGRGRGGRGGRGRGGGRGRRSTSGPPPEIDHNIEVDTIRIIIPPQQVY